MQCRSPVFSFQGLKSMVDRSTGPQSILKNKNHNWISFQKYIISKSFSKTSKQTLAFYGCLEQFDWNLIIQTLSRLWQLQWCRPDADSSSTVWRTPPSGRTCKRFKHSSGQPESRQGHPVDMRGDCGQHGGNDAPGNDTPGGHEKNSWLRRKPVKVIHALSM